MEEIKTAQERIAKINEDATEEVLQIERKYFALFPLAC
jgi:hypothetical protein